MLSHFSLLLLLSCFLYGCGKSESDAPLQIRERGDSPAYDQVWQVGTHNSFWAPHKGGDPFASGPRERLFDQMLADGSRSLEFDIHQSAPHSFRVYHLVPGDSLCDTLEECLAVVRAFHRTIPDHQPLLILIEFKELFQALFDDNHTIEDLDRTLTRELGPLLYRPADFLKACAAQHISNLLACEQQVGWPALAELKGRVLVAAMASWDMFGAVNTADWVHYSTAGDIGERIAFPMASSWRIDWSMLEPELQQLMTPDELQQAYSQSLFLQALGPEDAFSINAVKEGRFVRMDNAYSLADQERVVAARVQLLQTDTPWIRFDPGGVDLPIQSFSGMPTNDSLREPGNRLKLDARADAPQSLVFAHAAPVAADSTTTWETAIAAGSDPQQIGCLVAARELGTFDKMSVTLCRYLLPIEEGPDSVGQRLRLSICDGSTCQTEESKSTDGTMGGSGELVSLRIDVKAGQSCVTARSARLVDTNLEPLWTPLGAVHCIPAQLGYQGIARLGIPTGGQNRPVYFFNTSRNGTPVSSADLTTP